MKSVVTFVIIWCYSWGLCSQELPLIDVYLPDNYQAESQNWAISQADDGTIYCANNLGLLEFDGSRWQLYPTPNHTIMRSVNCIGDKVYSGSYMDFGFWEKDAYGTLQYTSLVAKHLIPIVEDEQFWNIIEVQDWLLFQSLQRIYIYDRRSEKSVVISATGKLTKMFKVDADVYYHVFGQGLFKIENGVGVLIAEDAVLQTDDIIDVIASENGLQILTNSHGFYYWKEGLLVPDNARNAFLNNRKVYNSLQLTDGGIAVGTIADGVIVFDAQGNVSYKLNTTNGLSNNTVLSLFQDKRDNIWLGLDKGINCIHGDDQMLVYRDVEGQLGTVYATAYFKEHIYLGTNQGLFVKNYKNEHSFHLIEGTQGQVWNLIVLEDELFCAHDRGTMVIKGEQLAYKISVQGTWDIKKVHPNIYIQGNYSGLYVLENQNGRWRVRNKLKGFDKSCRFFEFNGPYEIIVNHEYKGVFSLQTTKNFTEITAVTPFLNLQKGVHSSLITYRDKLLYAYPQGIYTMDIGGVNFQRDTVLSTLYSKDTYESGKLLTNSFDQSIWAFTKNTIVNVKPTDIFKNSLSLREIPYRKTIRKSAVGYENISALGGGNYIMGIDNGYVKFNLLRSSNKNGFSKVSINSIDNYGLNREKRKVKLLGGEEFANRSNNFEFFFNVPFDAGTSELRFQYFLEGHDSSWSPWSSKPRARFENLSYGEYKFRVRASLGGTMSDEEASFAFKIRKPWYLTNVMLATYGLLVLLFSLFMDRVYKNYYRRQRNAELEQQQRDFELLSMSREKELMTMKNNQLKIAVESKGRELASSTMSIVKKNELLSSIKKELKKGAPESIKKVISIIDNNINNQDDWDMFKEAFNNADKDFIKKLKSIHPNLTPNDLRLCAYLRLNLSSKEIAPLLNISPRSVEVKRYRLRKKMELKHDVNLTSYILEL